MTPPRSGPNCQEQCPSYPYADAAAPAARRDCRSGAGRLIHDAPDNRERRHAPAIPFGVGDFQSTVGQVFQPQASAKRWATWAPREKPINARSGPRPSAFQARHLPRSSRERTLPRRLVAPTSRPLALTSASHNRSISTFTARRAELLPRRTGTTSEHRVGAAAQTSAENHIAYDGRRAGCRTAPSIASG